MSDRPEAQRQTVSELLPGPSDAALGAPLLLIALTGAQAGRIYRIDKRFALIGRDDGADVEIVEAGISRRHAALSWDAAHGTGTLSDLGSRNGTRVNGAPCREGHVLRIGDKIQLGSSTVLRVSHPDEDEAQYAQRMYQSALRDGLTGIFNRRYLDERLDSELAFARRHDRALSLLMIDLDRFKAVNDDHGHLAGDAVLKELARLVTAQLRAEDVLARYGGEEFVVLCRDIDENRCSVLAQRIRRTVAQHPFDVGSAVLAVTCSIGVASFAKGKVESGTAILEAADKALYRAKAAGRNAVECASRR
ncbi:MAG: GGDEF domain-containing protein [Myxococcales bacterium]|nr:GGDEF domain-containing protein [Myxococcales bacterium]